MRKPRKYTDPTRRRESRLARVCRFLGVHRALVRYVPTRSPQEVLRARLREPALPAAPIVEALDTLLLVRGRPDAIVCDDGPEFVSLVLDQWANTHGVRLDFIRPVHPVENCFMRPPLASA